MNNSPLPPIDPAYEIEKMTAFIRSVLKRANHEKVIIAVSGGVDSATSLNVISRAVGVDDIIVVHLPYFDSSHKLFYETIDQLSLPQKNIILSPITDAVDMIAKSAGIILQKGSLGFLPAGRQGARDDKTNPEIERVRLGNIMARVRMTYLFDLAKKHKALVCGTENKSEYYLGYFTRFGDQASDFEVINHLYKSQVYEFARYLQIPNSIIDTPPSADLWDGQTDELEMGFSYKEADPVLYLHFEQGKSASEIEELGYKKVKLILDTARKNAFKHEVPYVR